MSELDEVLEIIDEDNRVIGSATRGECYKKGYLHRAVNLFIFNSKGEVFLHKRSEKKLKYPLFWDMSCSEHVKPSESFLDAAKRGIKEELGIEMSLSEAIPMHRIDSVDQNGEYHDNELVVTFRGIYDGVMEFDDGEVSDGRFFKVEEVNRLIKSKKLNFTPWFLKEWESLGS